MMLKKVLISIVILLLIGLGVWKIFFSQDTIKDKIENIKAFDEYFDNELKIFSRNFKKRRPNIKVFDEFILQTLKDKWKNAIIKI